MDYKLLIILFLIGTVPLFTGVMAVDLTVQKDTAADDLLNYTVYTNSYGVDQFWVDENGFVYANGTLVTSGTGGGGNITGSGGSSRIAFWDSDSNISSDSRLIFNNGTEIQFALVLNGTDVIDVPHQPQSQSVIMGTSGEFNINTPTLDIRQLQSWGINTGASNFVAVSGQAVANSNDTDNSNVWGANFGAFQRGTNNVVVGLEVGVTDLVAGNSGNEFGIVVVAHGTESVNNLIQLQAQAGSGKAEDGIKFSNDSFIDSLITTNNAVAPTNGIDLSLATFSGSNVILGSAATGLDLTGSSFSNAGIDMDDEDLIDVGVLNLGDFEELTIATGVITVTQTTHDIDTQSDGASDDLDTINGGLTGDLLILRAESGTRTVVIKDGTGNIQGAGDCSLDSSFDSWVGIYFTGTWITLSCSNNA